MAFALLSLIFAGSVASSPLKDIQRTGSVARTTTGKRGLPFNTANLTDLFTEYSAVTWGYNWSPDSNGLSSHFEFVPLLYSDPTGNQQYIDNWQTGAEAAIKAGSTHLLAFNEPDVNNLSPAQAAVSYKQFMQPFASDTVKLGAPAVTNGGAPDGLTWLGEFLGNCTECTIDFVPFHWYCGYEQVSYFTSYVQQAYAAAGNRPIWFTEFQADNVYCDAPATDAQQAQFMNTVIPWLDSLSYVQRYAYFMATESSSTQTFLVDEAGTGLTQSGLAYATINTVNSTTPTSLVNN